MCSWGSNNKIEKFYKGAQADTPWNKVVAMPFVIHLCWLIC